MRQKRGRIGNGLFAAMAAASVVCPLAAQACDGPAGAAVAISYDGGKYTVTNTGRALLQITFSASNTTYSLTLAPGQSGTPASSGWLNVPMKGYQSCTAQALPTR